VRRFTGITILFIFTANAQSLMHHFKKEKAKDFEVFKNISTTVNSDQKKYRSENKLIQDWAKSTN
jgi:hypothetical protein